MIHLDIQPDTIVDLPSPGKAPGQCHVFDEKSIDAVNAALAAQRPLLLRGEPGTGKTQLARAAAKCLNWAFISRTLDAKCEADDLFYKMDAVSRLGEAQIIGALGAAVKKKSGDPQENNADPQQDIRAQLAESRFLHPGPMWWAFNWPSAARQAQIVRDDPPSQWDDGEHDKGCVLLIDEIDKADHDVPNGLLEAFGNGRFHPLAMDEAVVRNDKPLLIIVTTNEEKALPDAFLRRCLVHHLCFEKGEALDRQLVKHGRAHFPKVADNVLSEAARQLRKDREKWLDKNMPAPGMAEYLDLVRAVSEMKSSSDEQLALLQEIKDFVLKKHPMERA